MIVESPVDARVQQLLDPTFAAARVSVRPTEWRSTDPNSTLVGGHFRTQIQTGNITVLNAGDAILSCRWASADKRLWLLGLEAKAYLVTAFGVAQEVALDLVKLSNFSAPDTGGTAIVLGQAGRLSSAMGASAIADLRVSTTTALGAGTATAEARASSYATFAIGNVATNVSSVETLARTGPLGHPLELLNLEGFRVRVGVTQGAAGVLRVIFNLDWLELPAAA